MTECQDLVKRCRDRGDSPRQALRSLIGEVSGITVGFMLDLLVGTWESGAGEATWDNLICYASGIDYGRVVERREAAEADEEERRAFVEANGPVSEAVARGLDSVLRPVAEPGTVFSFGQKDQRSGLYHLTASFKPKGAGRPHPAQAYQSESGKVIPPPAGPGKIIPPQGGSGTAPPQGKTSPTTDEVIPLKRVCPNCGRDNCPTLAKAG